MMRVGIFDSGIGGVSVLKSLLEAQLFEEMIYYGDTARVPYGTKDKETIIKYSLEALDFFAPHGLDLLIIACNTVSAYALEILRQRAPYPIIGVIESGVLALQNRIHNKDASILILATQATTQSQAYPIALNRLGYYNLTNLATPLFVPFVEEEILEGEFLRHCLDYYFHTLDSRPQAIILGCTHYPFIAQAIDAYFEGQSLLIHSGEAIVDDLKARGIGGDRIDRGADMSGSRLQFFSSQDSAKLQAQAQKLLAL